MFYKERKTIEKLLINCSLERTFLCLKPDGVQRGLLGKVLSKFEDRGYKLVGLKNLWASRELLEEHYAEHKGKPFFEKIIKYMSSGPVVAMVWEGTNIVQIGRKMLGATKPQESDIEKDFKKSISKPDFWKSSSLCDYFVDFTAKDLDLVEEIFHNTR